MLLKKLKRKLLNQSLKRLYNTVDADDILQLKKGQLFLKGKVMTEQDVKNLIEEVKMLEDMLLWKVLTHYVKGVSNERIFNKAQNDDDIVFGKACLYTLQIQKDLVSKIKKIK